MRRQLQGAGLGFRRSLMAQMQSAFLQNQAPFSVDFLKYRLKIGLIVKA